VCDTQVGTDIGTTEASDIEYYSYVVIYLKRSIAGIQVVEDGVNSVLCTRLVT